MTDRELLDMAAKAAGYQIEWVRNSGCHYRCEAEESREQWCPLDDDGDALRLAVKLGIDVEMHGMLVNFPFCCASAKNAEIQCEEEAVHVDDMESVRRAIVRAAAAIGSAL